MADEIVFEHSLIISIHLEHPTYNYQIAVTLYDTGRTGGYIEVYFEQMKKN